MDDKIKSKQDEIIDMINAFSKNNLDDEYCDLAVKLVEKMGRKNEVPFKRGKLSIWASAVILVIAKINSLFDVDSPNCISADDICDYFETKKSTVSNKANFIIKMFDVSILHSEFVLDNIDNSENFMDDYFSEVKHSVSIGFANDAFSKLSSIKPDNPQYEKALFYKSIILPVVDDDDFFKEVLEKSFRSYSKEHPELNLGDSFINNILMDVNDLKESAEAFTRGLEDYHEGNFENALKYFDLSLELDPDDEEVLYYKSLALARMEHFDIALDIIERAIDIDCEDDRFWNDRASFLTRLGDYDEAEKSFNKAIQLNPKDYILYANKGFMYRQLERYDDAVEAYKKACEIEGNVHNYVCLANVYADLYDFPKADEYFKKAAKIDDSDEEYLTAMAHYMMYQEELEKSIEYWDRLLKLNPNNAEVWMYKSMIYLMMNNQYDADICIDKAMDINPKIIDIFQREIFDD